MDKIDIYNNSAIILDKKTPKCIISWITILIILVILFIIFSFIPFNIYKSYSGYVSLKNKDSYITLSLNLSDFPINKSNILYIEGDKYDYEIIEISSNNVVLKVNLNSEIKIDNNIILVNILKERTTLYKILKQKIKKGIGI